jgi:hypothetical protein
MQIIIVVLLYKESQEESVKLSGEMSDTYVQENGVLRKKQQ